MLVAINLLTSPGVFWAIWPILGWGVKVVAHAAAVFGLPGYADCKDRVHRRYVRRHADRPAVEPGERAEETAQETQQLRGRVENLEAIVTSADWDLLVELSDTDRTASEEVAALEEKIVQGLRAIPSLLEYFRDTCCNVGPGVLL